MKRKASDADLKDLVDRLLDNASSKEARHHIIYDTLMKGLKLPEKYADDTIDFFEENDLRRAAELAEKVGNDYRAIECYAELAGRDDTLR